MNTCTLQVVHLKGISVFSLCFIDSVDSVENTLDRSRSYEDFLYLTVESIEKRSGNLSQTKLTQGEARALEESLNSDVKTVSIRLRQGEYQHDLAKGIASFQLELNFPDVKDLIEKLYGEEKTNENQFIRNIQTILKKMENNNIVKILPKNKPWELQRYALSGFKFLDVEKNLVTLATTQQIERTQHRLHSAPNSLKAQMLKPSYMKTKILLSIFLIVISYTVALWSLLQPIINPIIFTPAFSAAFTCSLILGKLLSQK